MTSERVRDAYSALSAEYIDLHTGDWLAREDPTRLATRHLSGVTGRVLDLGCGPGHWTAHLHALGVDVAGVDLVPGFVAHARATYPGPSFDLGSMTELDVPDGTIAGILAWFSTIHLAPPELDGVLAGYRRLLSPGGRLVLGFFSADEQAPFDHRVLTAYRWPVDQLTERLRAAGFAEVERATWQHAGRPDRTYAAIAAVA
ncbi:MAG: class I SAM-dependent DNA methyltransferase, partial [Mycobacteriales bacterium]